MYNSLLDRGDVLPTLRKTVKLESSNNPFRKPTLEVSHRDQSANLDFLRASAVMFVYVGHLLQILHVQDAIGSTILFNIQATGVLIFFVHTSLVLMLSLRRQPKEVPLLSAFYIRRAFRIYPLAIVVTLTMLILRLPAFPTEQWSPPSMRTVISNLALIQNITNVSSLYAPLWSLPFEVQMYLLLPVIFLFLKRFNSDVAALGLWSLCAILAVICGGESLVRYFPCFLGGIVGYSRLNRGKRGLPFWGWPLMIGASVIFRSIAAMSGIHNVVLPSGWIICLSLGWSVTYFEECAVSWIKSTASCIAKYSFGIYLTHVAVFWLAFIQLNGSPLMVRICVCLIGSIILPVFSYHLIEEPFVRVGLSITRKMRNSRAGYHDTGECLLAPNTLGVAPESR